MRRRRAHHAVLALACAASLPALPDTSISKDHLDVPHPGRAVALRLTERAAGLLSGDDVDENGAREALALLWAGLENDPLLAAAWINLSAAYIHACEPRRAIFSATTARLLDPSITAAVGNLRMARRLDCPDPAGSVDEIELAEHAALDDQASPEGWRELARAHRGTGRPLLAALFELFALERGGTRDAVVAAAVDLETAGLWRAAASMLAAADSSAAAESRDRIEKRLAALRPAAESIGRDVAHRFGLQDEAQRSFVVAVTEVMLARGMTTRQAVEEFETWYGVKARQVARGPFGELTMGRLWHPLQERDEPGWPLLTIRRFPGDTQLALFGWPSNAPKKERPEPLVVRLLRALGATRLSDWALCEAAEGLSCEHAPFEVDLGIEGRHPVDVFVVGSGDGRPRGVAVGLIGDAGCGPDCAREARADVAGLVATWQPPPRSEAKKSPDRWLIPTPRAWQSPNEHDESERPWRSFRLADDARIDLPPGLIVAEVQGMFASSDATPHTRLWLRGQFRDGSGTLVEIGDPFLGGTVDLFAADEEIEADPRRWTPPADPEAGFVASTALGETFLRIGTFRSGRVARFEGRRFQGTWLVSQTVLAGSGRVVRIRIPVAQGRRSPSLLWIPFSARDAESQGPPPLVELMDTYDVRFQPMRDDERSQVDPRGGWLLADRLRVAVPKESRVSLNSDSVDGFPVTIRGRDGTTGRVDRWPPSPSADAESRLGQAQAYEGEPPTDGWSAGKRARGGRVYAARFAGSRKGEEHDRCVAVLVPESAGEAAAYRVRLTRGDGVSEDWWDVMCELVESSLEYRKR